MENYIMLIYPALIVILLFACAKVSRVGEYVQDAWSVKQAKAMQAVAALMIILHHCVQTVTKYDKVYKGPITEWNSFGILFTSVFFFFSGFGLYTSYKNKPDYMKGFLSKHLPKLLIPFFITNILYLIVVGTGRVSSALDVFTSIFGLTLINTNAWFLVELIILYIAFYLCFTKASNGKKAFIYLSLFTTVMVIAALLLGHDNTRINGHWFMGEWWYNTTFIFLMGMIVAKYEKRLKSMAEAAYKWLLPVTVVLFVAWYQLEEYVIDNLGYYMEWRWHPGYLEKTISLLTQTILCALFICVLLLICMKVQFSNRVLTFLGGISFEIYLIHDIFRQALYNNGHMPDAEYIGLVIALSIVGAWLLSLVDSKVKDFYFSNESSFRIGKKDKENSELSYEAKQKQKKARSIIRVIKGIYIVAGAGLCVTFVMWLYSVTLGASKTFDTEMETIKTAEVGDVVYYGKWELDYRNGTEERIPWVVYDIVDDHALLIAKDVLANVSYHDYHEETIWKESRLCRLLNHDFYNEAFSNKERGQLCGRYDKETYSWCENENDAFDYYINKDGVDDFEDVIVKKELVFIPSMEDLAEYMPSDTDRIAYATAAAVVQGVGNINNDYRAAWWIENQGTNEMSAMYVDANGHVDEAGKTINNAGMGVRPAIWITFN